jgi:hypothetical protein
MDPARRQSHEEIEQANFVSDGLVEARSNSLMG